MLETPEIRRKRLIMRSGHRGIKEMDMILGPFSLTELVALDGPALDAYEDMLEENDHDLYMWLSGRVEMPPEYLEIGALIQKFHKLV